MHTEAQYIWSQLGGAAFGKRIRATRFISSDRTLQFSIPEAHYSNINRVRITRNRHGLYDMIFYCVDGFRVSVVREALNLHPDGLSFAFSITGSDRLYAQAS